MTPNINGIYFFFQCSKHVQHRTGNENICFNFPYRKRKCFHWDLFWLCLCVFVARSLSIIQTPTSDVPLVVSSNWTFQKMHFLFFMLHFWIQWQRRWWQCFHRFLLENLSYALLSWLISFFFVCNQSTINMIKLLLVQLIPISHSFYSHKNWAKIERENRYIQNISIDMKCTDLLKEKTKEFKKLN